MSCSRVLEKLIVAQLIKEQPPSMELERSFQCWLATGSYPELSLGLRPCVTFHNMLVFYTEELLTPAQPQAVCNCLFNTVTATFKIWKLPPPSTTQDVPWHGDRGSLNMDTFSNYSL